MLPKVNMHAHNITSVIVQKRVGDGYRLLRVQVRDKDGKALELSLFFDPDVDPHVEHKASIDYRNK